MLVAGVFFFRGTQNLPYNASKEERNDIFPELKGLSQTEYKY